MSVRITTSGAAEENDHEYLWDDLATHVAAFLNGKDPQAPISEAKGR